jgi:hypothetical protein
VKSKTRNNAELAGLFVQECRNRKIILPGITVIERLCADSRVAAEREIVGRIASRLDERMKKNLNTMLEEIIDGRLTVPYQAQYPFSLIPTVDDPTGHCR